MCVHLLGHVNENHSMVVDLQMVPIVLRFHICQHSYKPRPTCTTNCRVSMAMSCLCFHGNFRSAVETWKEP